MKAYSPDLRQKIVDLYQQGEGSIRQLAQRFAVSPDFVRLLLKRERETGTVAPTTYTRGPKPQLNQTHYLVLEGLLEADNDATLPQLATRLQSQTGIEVSPSTVSRTLKKMGISRKKKVSKRPKSMGTSRNNSDKTIGR
jgi:transposase